MSLMMACLFGVVVTIIVTWIAVQSTQSKGPEVHRMKRGHGAHRSAQGSGSVLDRTMSELAPVDVGVPSDGARHRTSCNCGSSDRRHHHILAPPRQAVALRPRPAPRGRRSAWRPAAPSRRGRAPAPAGRDDPPDQLAGGRRSGAGSRSSSQLTNLANDGVTPAGRCGQPAGKGYRGTYETRGQRPSRSGCERSASTCSRGLMTGPFLRMGRRPGLSCWLLSAEWA